MKFIFNIVLLSMCNHRRQLGKIIPNSPADNGQLKIGDRIIRVNDIDITNMTHGDVVKIIKESGLTVQLTVSNCTIARSTDFISEANHSPYSSNVNTNSSNINSNNSNPLNINSFPMLT